MANTLKEISHSLREAIRRASAFTVALEREPYSVSGVLIGGDRVLTASHCVGDEGAVVVMPDGKKVNATLACGTPCTIWGSSAWAGTSRRRRPALRRWRLGTLLFPSNGIHSTGSTLLSPWSARQGPS